MLWIDRDEEGRWWVMGEDDQPVGGPFLTLQEVWEKFPDVIEY